MKLTDEHLAAGRIDEDEVRLLREVWDVAGLISLEGVVPASLLADTRARVHEARDADGTYITQRTLDGEDTGVGCSFFPFVAPFDAPEVVENPILFQVASAIMGEDFVCRIYNTNLSSPGSLSQPVHVDVPSLTPDGDLRDVPLVSAQVLLCDFTSENGSTELWPGTHKVATAKEDAHGMALRSQEYPSVRANYPAGSIFLRDPSVWHRGMANHTPEWREMLSLFLAPRGTVYAEQTFGRPLEIPEARLTSMSDGWRRVWDVNLVTV